MVEQPAFVQRTPDLCLTACTACVAATSQCPADNVLPEACALFAGDAPVATCIEDARESKPAPTSRPGGRRLVWWRVYRWHYWRW